MCGDSNDTSTEEHPFLIAASDLDDALDGLRHDIIVPFAQPATSEAHFTVWHEHERTSHDECESAALHWIRHGDLPPASDNALYFLRHRFDEFAAFLRMLVLDDGTSMFDHRVIALDLLLFWGLVQWWDSHGIREAYFQDLAFFEDQHDVTDKT